MLLITDSLFKFQSTRQSYREAPLIQEREAFLIYLYGLRVSSRRLRSISALLVHIVRILKMEPLRIFNDSEVRLAAKRWTTDAHRVKGNRNKNEKSFYSLAVRWLRYANLLLPSPTVLTHCDVQLHHFLHYMTYQRGLSRDTIRSYYQRTSSYLKWAKDRNYVTNIVNLRIVNEYLTLCIDRNFRPATIASICSALRAFFSYLESQDQNLTKISQSIHCSRSLRHETATRGPSWEDVRQLVEYHFGANQAEYRAAAIIRLAALYGLRRSEIVRLTLEDLDWETETIIVRRSKNFRLQRFPLRLEVGDALVTYLKLARPPSSYREIFLTLAPPYRPMDPTITHSIVSSRLKLLKIHSANCGLHALRHSCATELMRQGASLKEIADFLGHSNLKSVSIYVKHDLETLLEVSDFSLADLS